MKYWKDVNVLMERLKRPLSKEMKEVQRQGIAKVDKAMDDHFAALETEEREATDSEKGWIARLLRHKVILKETLER